MELVRTAQFEKSFRLVRDTNAALFEELAANLRYLLREKRHAEMPQVRFGIRDSSYSEMGEVRTHIPGKLPFLRTLFAMPTDESVCAFLVLGDKNSQLPTAPTGNAWYDQAIPVADKLWAEIRTDRQQGRSPPC